MNEPLRGKKINLDRKIPVKKEEVFRKRDVKSAVEFYKKYKNQSGKLEMDYIDIWKEWKNQTKDNYKWYDDWLFDYCFGDVID